MNQCNQPCSSANRVAAVCRLSWRTPGPPGRSLIAKAVPVNPPKAASNAANL